MTWAPSAGGLIVVVDAEHGQEQVVGHADGQEQVGVDTASASLRKVAPPP